MLSIKWSAPESLTVGEVVERLQIQHHSAVELVARAEARGPWTRRACPGTRGEEDRRQIFIRLTPVGDVALCELSSTPHREPRSSAPEFIRILQQVIADDASCS